MNHNLFATFEAGFPAGRNRPCMILPNGRTISYGELLAGAGRIAKLPRNAMGKAQKNLLRDQRAELFAG